jgi:hypothetical protein
VYRSSRSPLFRILSNKDCLQQVYIEFLPTLYSLLC